MTVVDHGRDRDLTVQGRQAAQARAVLHFAEDDHLPTLTWSISDAVVATLSGLLYCDQGDVAGQIASFREWCAYLKAAPTETFERGRVEMHVAGWAHGVPVHVWTRIPTATTHPLLAGGAR